MSIKTAFAPATPEPSDIVDWARKQHEVITDALNNGMERLRLQVLNAPPLRPREGDVVFADGVNWNPGGGKGFYGYKAGGWVLLG